MVYGNSVNSCNDLAYCVIEILQILLETPYCQLEVLEFNSKIQANRFFH